MEKLMKETSIAYLEKLIKAQDECTTAEIMRNTPVVYTHVEGFDKQRAIYEMRIFMALGKYIKDITVDVAFACDYEHNNRRLYYQAKGEEDPEQAVIEQLSSVLYDGGKDSIGYMKI